MLEASGLPVEDLFDTSRMHFFVAEQGNAVAGCIGLEMLGVHALVRSLAVRPPNRDAGIGRCLLKAAERECTRHNVRDTYLLTLTAEKYFVRHGYERIERQGAPADISSTTEFTSTCPASSVLMTKHL